MFEKKHERKNQRKITPTRDGAQFCSEKQGFTSFSLRVRCPAYHQPGHSYCFIMQRRFVAKERPVSFNARRRSHSKKKAHTIRAENVDKQCHRITPEQKWQPLSVQRSSDDVDMLTHTCATDHIKSTLILTHAMSSPRSGCFERVDLSVLRPRWTAGEISYTPLTHPLMSAGLDSPLPFS